MNELINEQMNEINECMNEWIDPYVLEKQAVWTISRSHVGCSEIAVDDVFLVHPRQKFTHVTRHMLDFGLRVRVRLPVGDSS